MSEAKRNELAGPSGSAARCRCTVDMGWTLVHCCNTCGLPLQSEPWDSPLLLDVNAICRQRDEDRATLDWVLYMLRHHHASRGGICEIVRKAEQRMANYQSSTKTSAIGNLPNSQFVKSAMSATEPEEPKVKWATVFECPHCGDRTDYTGQFGHWVCGECAEPFFVGDPDCLCVEIVSPEYVELERENEKLRALGDDLALAIRRDDDSKHAALAAWDDLSNVSREESSTGSGTQPKK